jgi:hypothetical protein
MRIQGASLPQSKTVLKTRSALLFVDPSSGSRFRLNQWIADIPSSPRKPLRIHLTGPGSSAIATLQLSRREAYALAEWLDRVVTTPQKG